MSAENAQTLFIRSLLSIFSSLFSPISSSTMSSRTQYKDEEFAPRPSNANDLVELERVTKVGKRACLGGMAITSIGALCSIAGLIKDTGELFPHCPSLSSELTSFGFEGATKFKNWFGASLASWILILFAQGVCTWEVLDRAKRHNAKLVNRCKWVYVVSLPFLPISSTRRC